MRITIRTRALGPPPRMGYPNNYIPTFYNADLSVSLLTVVVRLAEILLAPLGWRYWADARFLQPYSIRYT